jgi:DNA-binding NarL/FixJ family response regulator
MHHDEQVAQSMYQAGAEAFLTKSVSSDELLKAIYNNPHYA